VATNQPSDARRAPASQSLFATGRPEPPADAPVEARLARILGVQADACALMGSPLYGDLLEHAARDAAEGGPTASLLADQVDEGRADALALRFMAAAHRMVLLGRAPRLAGHYPSAGGDAGAGGAWPELRALLVEAGEELSALVRLPCQTNEVGRCAGLSWGFLEVARLGLPLRLLEVGASAGLLLRWDRYRYAGPGVSFGPADSPVDLGGMWSQAPPALGGTPPRGPTVRVVERRGCDPSPVDPGTAEGRLGLRAAVWADQRVRFRRLDGALQVAERVPAALDRASVEDWLPERLAETSRGVATVVYHSVVEEYLGAEQRAAMHRALAAAGERATARAPLAWVRLEPISELRHHGVTLTTWPSGDQRVLAVCGAHGHDVRRPEGP
jgi:hypothetical protein